MINCRFYAAYARFFPPERLADGYAALLEINAGYIDWGGAALLPIHMTDY